MPDIDVGVVSLATPPASAPRTSYRPAVSVRNNGVKPAQAGGTLSIHDVAAGRLVLQLSLPPLPIQPGATRQLPADADWSPTVEDIGHRFLFTTWVSCPGDMVPANNYLTALVTVTGESPPTPPVARHASQHEDGGSDELDATGLSGRLREPQTPTAHAAAHQDGGADELALDGLSGKLKDPQTPDTHSNTAHTVPYCALEDAAALVGAHNASPEAHATNTNLERVVNKGAPSGYAPLGTEQPAPLVPALNLGAHPVIDRDTVLTLRADTGEREWAPVPALEVHGADKHDATVEATAHKGAANGYAPLGPEVSPLVPAANLADVPVSEPEDRFLHLHVPSGERTWAPGPPAEVTYGDIEPLAPGTPNENGVEAAAARADHRHQSPGGIAAAAVPVSCPPGVTTLLDSTVPRDVLHAKSVIRIEAYLYISAPEPAASATVDLWLDGGMTARTIFDANITGPVTDRLLHYTACIALEAENAPATHAYIHAIAWLPMLGLMAGSEATDPVNCYTNIPHQLELQFFGIGCSAKCVACYISHDVVIPALQ